MFFFFFFKKFQIAYQTQANLNYLIKIFKISRKKITNIA